MRKSKLTKKEMGNLGSRVFGDKKLSCIIFDEEGIPIGYAPIMDVPRRIVHVANGEKITLEFPIILTEE